MSLTLPSAKRKVKPRVDTSALSGHDRSVVKTNDDATISKIACVKAKYYSDPYLQHFGGRAEKRNPLINRGYYARVKAITRSLEKFLQHVSPERAQVVSLGGGYDTMYFRLCDLGLRPSLYVEVDFPAVLKAKYDVVSVVEDFKKHLQPSVGQVPESQGSCSPSGSTPFWVRMGSYGLVGCDLRNWDTAAGALREMKLDPQKPTMLISECVLIYLDPKHSCDVISWAASTFSHCSFLSYEQIRPDDAFGRVMVKNIEDLGCPLLGIHAYPTLEAQCERFRSCGWQTSSSHDMLKVYQRLEEEDRLRIEKLEFLDEFEEWNLLMIHYALTWAAKGDLTDFEIPF